MGNSETFGLYINHGGVVVNLEGHVEYFGGNYVSKLGLDEDRFGYFDLKDEVEKLGYVSWDGLFYKIPYTNVFKTLNDDNDIMDMLKHLSARCRLISIFVDNGKKLDYISSEQVDGDLTQLSMDEVEIESGFEEGIDEGQDIEAMQQEGDNMGIPCVHAISAINFLNLNPTSFVHDYYSVDKYIEAYKYGLEPLNGKKMWPVVEGYPVRPPAIKKMPGRPKKKRRRDPNESNPKDHNKLRNIGVAITCKRCMQEGHNSRTCKSDPVEAPPRQQKKRGRPPKAKVLGSVEREAVAKGKAVVAKRKENSGVAKERAVARKGYGVVAFPETGNIYMPSRRGVHLVNPRVEKDKDPLLKNN